MKYKRNNWIDMSTDTELYGIDVVEKGQTYHLSENGNPLFFKTAKDRDEKLKELKSK